MLSKFEEAEIAAPSARKELKDRTIYTSIGFLPSNGLPLLSDFGEARFGDEKHDEDIMPNVYRAPEVILKTNWGYKVDIWNIAMLAWDIVSSHTLIGELVALLGPPPPEFRELSKPSSVFWDEDGKSKELAPIPDITLEGLSAKIGKIIAFRLFTIF
ncbi:hypothetical protein SI65_08949 [Aspergillus cristatus]|uniref:Protein kinase domain-containing protein n=1 Tax=Aspergillus cristatus TaxID=573508 RepID=A0A1E3B417_ASPCR|nr:hypothetical protein SI65_08949 [Aspergillus cristatus]